MEEEESGTVGERGSNGFMKGTRRKDGIGDEEEEKNKREASSERK